MPAKIVFVGEAWGSQEALLQSPFVGPSGCELYRMLHAAGYSVPFLPYQFNSPVRMLNNWAKFPYPLLNVFNAHPPENNIEFFYTREPPAAKPKLTCRPGANSLLFAKDQAKWEISNKFIGFGSEHSSTNHYAKTLRKHGLANTGNYTADDVVLLSIEGNRAGSEGFGIRTISELDKAIKAKATIVTDKAGMAFGQRGSSHNTNGEGKAAIYLASKGYIEDNGNGIWRPDGKPNICAKTCLEPRRLDNRIHYVKPEYESHITQLHMDLQTLAPNVIVALGNTALWALNLPVTISKLRGNVVESPFGKVVPTYHPASVLRNWSQRVVTILDLHKALRESKSPLVSTPAREIWTRPSIDDLYSWWEQYGKNASLLAFDIETVLNKQISEISFASDSTHALHVPFFYKEARRYINWWPDAATEREAWQFVKMVLESDIPKIGQNCVQYDCYWLVKEMGIAVKNVAHDTMQMSHAWALELEKSLGFLGSIFLDERSWKHIRVETGKQND